MVFYSTLSPFVLSSALVPGSCLCLSYLQKFVQLFSASLSPKSTDSRFFIASLLLRMLSLDIDSESTALSRQHLTSLFKFSSDNSSASDLWHLCGSFLL